MRLNKNHNGFTLIETLISLTLLALLFSVLGGFLFGMSKLAHLTDKTTGRSREISFCYDLIRKELGEIVIKNNDPRFTLLVGENFFSYATMRKELVSRDAIARGIKRVEWRYFPMRKVIIRTVSPIMADGQEEGPTTTREFLKGTEKFELSYFSYDQWYNVNSNSEILEDIHAIKLTLKFPADADIRKLYSVSTGFILPR